MKRVHVITLPEKSGREISLDRMCRLTAILIASRRGVTVQR